MNKKGIFIEIIIGVGLLIIGFFWFTSQSDLENGLENETLGETLENELEEYLEEKCVPASCCHADSCVWESDAPDCSDILCTMECAPNTMDCGAGYCELIDGECEVVWNE